MGLCKTVLGDVDEKDLGVVLVHEHICCYSEYLFQMAGEKYLDKARLTEASVRYLKALKEQYGLTTFVDCTPVNIGRDVELLKRVSEESGVNIICSTGFYYTEEVVMRTVTTEDLAEYILTDAEKVNAGIIKCAVEHTDLSEFDQKVLKATALAHLKSGLPIVMHTNANNKNGLKALSVLLSEGVKPHAITVGHLSDTEDIEYVKQIAEIGCFIGFDRLHADYSEEYISKKVNAVHELCNAGREGQILLSHDSLFYSGFSLNPEILEKPRLAYCFESILPRLSKTLADKIMIENPARMLRGGK